MGSIRKIGDPLEIFESGRAIQILRYICANEGCLKTDVYRDVSRNPGMPGKMDELEAAGLIMIEVCGRSAILHPTEAGRRVDSLLSEISGIVEALHEGSEEPPPARSIDHK